MILRALACSVLTWTLTLPCFAQGPQSVDDWMQKFIQEHGVPGASLAVVKAGELLYAQGFGFADAQKSQAVTTASRFRIASIAKPITAVAILRLVELGRFELDDRLLEVLPVETRFGRKAEDSRWQDITIRQLLQHRAGWNRDGGFDPMFIPARVQQELELQERPTPWQIMEYMWRQPLNFTPGSDYSYSNFGYCILGRVIEAHTKQSYAQAVHTLVLNKLGLKSFAIGQSTAEQALKNEVHYAGPRAYQHDQVVMDAHGGWIANATDLAFFADAFWPESSPQVLNDGSIQSMWERPSPLLGTATKKPATWYALGWSVRDRGEKGLNAWHAGYLWDGSSTLMVRRHDGYCWAVLFNYDRSKVDGKSLSSHFDGAFHGVVNRVKNWRRSE